MKDIRNLSMVEFDDLVYNELDQIENIELLILKGHIIIEYLLNCYIESISQNSNEDFSKENFSFANKVKILKYFGELCKKDKNILNELIILNQLRNNIAHSFEINTNYLSKFITECEKKVPMNRKVSDKDKFIAIIALLTGEIQGAYKAKKKP